MNRKVSPALVATVAALATLAVIMFIIFLLVLTGQIRLKSAEDTPHISQVQSEQTNPAESATEVEEQPTQTPEPPTASPEDEPSADAKQNNSDVQPTTMYVANVKNSIYLRSTPEEIDSNILTTIPVGTPVIWMENTSTVFSKVSYGGTTGYVKRDYLSGTVPQKKPTSTQPPASNTTVSKYVYVANVENSIYLRSSAAEYSNNIITTIPVGTQVGYIEPANSVFSKIKYNGTVGYAKTCYLSDYYYKKPSTPSSTYFTVSNVKTSIYLRSTPKEDPNNIICEIPLGTVVRYLGESSGGFYKISYNGYIGYSKSIYLE